MFGKIVSKEFCAVFFLLAHVAGMAYGAPVVLRQRQVDESTNGTHVEIVPLVPGAQIDPVLVDLWDRVSNLQLQVDQAQPGAPGFDALVQLLNDTKASLDQHLNGVAVLSTVANTPAEPTATQVVASTITETVSTTTLPAEPSSTQSASTTGSASPSTTTLPPSASINTDVPVVTVVTQVGTSIVVLASQGVTSTVTLATITGVQSATPTSSAVVSSALPSGASASASGSTPSASIVTAPASSATLTSIPTQGSAVSVAQGGFNSGASNVALAGSQMIMGLIIALIVSVLL